MQAGSLYYHFDSKDAIVEEVLAVGLEHARDAIRAALNAAGDDASGHDRLMAAVVAYVTAITLDSDFTIQHRPCRAHVREHRRRWSRCQRLSSAALEDQSEI